MTVQDYLAQQVNYGGEWVSIGSLYSDLGDIAASNWLAGYRAGGGEFITIGNYSEDD